MLAVFSGAADGQIFDDSCCGEGQMSFFVQDQLSAVGFAVVNTVPDAGICNGDARSVLDGGHSEVRTGAADGGAVAVVQRIRAADDDGAAAQLHQLFPSLIQGCVLILVGVGSGGIVVAGGGLQGAFGAAAIAFCTVTDENNIRSRFICHGGECAQRKGHCQRQEQDHQFLQFHISFSLRGIL